MGQPWIYSFLASVALSGSLASYGYADSTLVIEREVLISPGRVARDGVLVATPDGGFVVAGNRNGAWAVRLNASGETIWEFADGQDDLKKSVTGDSSFKGAVVLADDSVLLCGAKQLRDSGIGLLVHVAANGHVLNQKYLKPRNDPKYFYSRIDQCLSWGDGVVLLGHGSASENGSVGWIVNLDAHGNQLWEKTGDYAASDAMETGNHDLILALRNSLPVQSAKLVRVGRAGEILASRIITNSNHFFLVHTLAPGDAIRFGSIDWPTTTLRTLSRADFTDLAPPTQFTDFYTRRAFVVGDQSVVLLGQTRIGKSDTAAVARMSANGKLGQPIVFEPPFHSVAATDGVLLSAREFVIVRDSVVQNPKESGVTMSWLLVH
jgi:hypothetical protein